MQWDAFRSGKQDLQEKNDDGFSQSRFCSPGLRPCDGWRAEKVVNRETPLQGSNVSVTSEINLQTNAMKLKAKH